MAEMYDNPQHVEDTFNRDNLDPYLLQAQWAEFVKLKEIIAEIAQTRSALRILDIGIGDARVLSHLVGIKEIWDVIGRYDGIDVSEQCVDISNRAIQRMGIQNQATAKLLDATDLASLQAQYDLIISTWFTVGNFFPPDFDPQNFEPGKCDMTTNAKFTSIFHQAHGLLNPDGEIVIGSMYIDNDETRKKQEASYRHFGWTVITDERDCFTASADGWWSQRFTEQRVYDYLPFVPQENISFIPLDTYNYAMMVRIKR